MMTSQWIGICITIALYFWIAGMIFSLLCDDEKNPSNVLQNILASILWPIKWLIG